MIKKITVLMVVLFLLYSGVVTSEDISFEMFTTAYDVTTSSPYLSGLILHIGAVAIYLSFIESALDSVFRLRYYIYARGNMHGLVFRLWRAVTIQIALVLLVKQLVYVLTSTSSFFTSPFYWYDMVSTFVTLQLLGFLLMVMKLHGVRSSLSFAGVLFTVVVGQILSYEYLAGGLVVIAAAGWEDQHLLLLMLKSLLTVALFIKAFSFTKPDHLMGAVER